MDPNWCLRCEQQKAQNNDSYCSQQCRDDDHNRPPFSYPRYVERPSAPLLLPELPQPYNPPQYVATPRPSSSQPRPWHHTRAHATPAPYYYPEHMFSPARFDDEELLSTLQPEVDPVQSPTSARNASILEWARNVEPGLDDTPSSYAASHMHDNANANPNLNANPTASGSSTHAYSTPTPPPQPSTSSSAAVAELQRVLRATSLRQHQRPQQPHHPHHRNYIEEEAEEQQAQAHEHEHEQQAQAQFQYEQQLFDRPRTFFLPPASELAPPRLTLTDARSATHTRAHTHAAQAQAQTQTQTNADADAPASAPASAPTPTPTRTPRTWYTSHAPGCPRTHNHEHDEHEHEPDGHTHTHTSTATPLSVQTADMTSLATPDDSALLTPATAADDDEQQEVAAPAQVPAPPVVKPQDAQTRLLGRLAGRVRGWVVVAGHEDGDDVARAEHRAQNGEGEVGSARVARQREYGYEHEDGDAEELGGSDETERQYVRYQYQEMGVPPPRTPVA